MGAGRHVSEAIFPISNRLRASVPAGTVSSGRPSANCHAAVRVFLLSKPPVTAPASRLQTECEITRAHPKPIVLDFQTAYFKRLYRVGFSSIGPSMVELAGHSPTRR